MNRGSLWNDSISNQKNGMILFEDERMLLTSSSVFGTLRKELLQNIGVERVKGFLIRYGWNLGINDAKKVLKKQLPSLKDNLRQGPILHMFKGYTKTVTKKLLVESDSDQQVRSVHVEGEWHYSYEAEEHERQFGLVKDPICHTLTGYASGYYSTICGHNVIFKELSCKGTGEEYCTYIGKSVELWNGDIGDELKYYEDSTIVDELERTYETLLQERNNLSKASEINKRLTQELINGSDLQSIVDVVYETTNIPIIIEDLHFRDHVYTGLSKEQSKLIKDDFQCWLQKHQYSDDRLVSYLTTRKIQTESHNRLLIPVTLQKKIVGYCSFIYHEEIKQFPDIDYMILERIASITSLYLLNEKTSFESMERMKGHFLEQVLSGQYSSKHEVIKRGRYINMDLESPFYIAILKYQYDEVSLQKELTFHEEMMETILNFYHKKNAKVIIGQRATDTVLFVQIDENNVRIAQLCEQFISHLSSSLKEPKFSMGISSIVQDVLDAPLHYEKALSALNMTNSYRRVVSFDKLGMIGLLMHAKNDQIIVEKAKSVLDALVKNSDSRDTGLIKTLYVFLQNGGNLERTMEDLSISKSGLRYRIQKIENCLEQDLRDPDVSYHLRMTLQVLILKGEIKLDE